MLGCQNVPLQGNDITSITPLSRILFQIQKNGCGGKEWEYLKTDSMSTNFFKLLNFSQVKLFNLKPSMVNSLKNLF